MPSFFVPTLPDLIAQESPPRGIWHPRQKNANAQESARGGGGVGWVGRSWKWLDRCITTKCTYSCT